MIAASTYTYAQLSKSNTERLMRIYNRTFNTNAWEVFFNPYENRGNMIVELMEEFRLMKAMELLGEMPANIEKYKSMKVVVTPDGYAIMWNTGVKTAGNRKVTDEQMALIRELREDGETMEWIAQAVGIGKKMVFEVLGGRYSTTANRWNTVNGDLQTVKPMRQSKTTFKAASKKADYSVFVTTERPNAAFWMEMGL